MHSNTRNTVCYRTVGNAESKSWKRSVCETNDRGSELRLGVKLAGSGFLKSADYNA